VENCIIHGFKDAADGAARSLVMVRAERAGAGTAVIISIDTALMQ
jgi:hypothetical protein